MGLLKGAGRELRGLFAPGGLLDNLGAAQAWLEGDYERGMALAGRNRRNRLRGLARKDPLSDPQAHEEAHVDPMTRDWLMVDGGAWKPWR